MKRDYSSTPQPYVVIIICHPPNMISMFKSVSKWAISYLNFFCNGKCHNCLNTSSSQPLALRKAGRACLYTSPTKNSTMFSRQTTTAVNIVRIILRKLQRYRHHRHRSLLLDPSEPPNFLQSLLLFILSRFLSIPMLRSVDINMRGPRPGCCLTNWHIKIDIICHN